MNKSKNGTRNAEETKARILESSLKMFSIYGYHGTTTRMIAKEAHIDISTVYYHFGEKSAVFNATWEYVNEEILKMNRQIKKTMDEASDAKEGFLKAAEIAFEFMFDNPEYSHMSLHGLIHVYKEDTKQEGIFQTAVIKNNLGVSRTMAKKGGKSTDDSEFALKISGLLYLVNVYIVGEKYFCATLNIKKENYKKWANQIISELFVDSLWR